MEMTMGIVRRQTCQWGHLWGIVWRKCPDLRYQCRITGLYMQRLWFVPRRAFDQPYY